MSASSGLALQCAFRELQVNESFPISIALSWKGFDPDTQYPDSQYGEPDNHHTAPVFPKSNQGFYSRSGTFPVALKKLLVICSLAGTSKVQYTYGDQSCCI